MSKLVVSDASRSIHATYLLSTSKGGRASNTGSRRLRVTEIHLKSAVYIAWPLARRTVKYKGNVLVLVPWLNRSVEENSEICSEIVGNGSKLM